MRQIAVLSTIARTIHHPGNLPMIALNRQLGYSEAEWKPSG